MCDCIDLQTAITKYMPGRRRGQQTLSPILESAAEAVTEESAVARRKTRGRVSKARTGEGLQKNTQCVECPWCVCCCLMS